MNKLFLPLLISMIWCSGAFANGCYTRDPDTCTISYGTCGPIGCIRKTTYTLCRTRCECDYEGCSDITSCQEVEFCSNNLVAGSF